MTNLNADGQKEVKTSSEENEIDDIIIDKILDIFRKRLYKTIGEKGREPFTSPHEALGVITEEYHEFISEVHDHHGNLWSEALDIAVAAIWVNCTLEKEFPNYEEF
jgi:hypothetical protein